MVHLHKNQDLDFYAKMLLILNILVWKINNQMGHDKKFYILSHKNYGIVSIVNPLGKSSKKGISQKKT